MPARGKHCQLDHMYAADLETCDDLSKDIVDLVIDEESGIITPIYPQRAWLSGCKNLETMESKYFTSFDAFMGWMLAKRDNKNIEVAFHNLRFDGSYIVPWLLNNGYYVTQEKPEPREFSVLIDERNAWYSITIQVSARRKVTIWDSAKLFPMQLKVLHDVYGTPTQKLHEPQSFYNEVRMPGHKPTEEEKMYFENDLAVLAETLNAHIERYGLLFKKTQASQAFREFEKSFPSWKRRFPALEDDLDKAIRPAYWGGISYVSLYHVGKDVYDIGVYDINSSYPYQQAYRKLPYGEKLFTYRTDTHPEMSKFWIAEATVRFHLKDGKVPCIPKKAVIEGDVKGQEKWLTSSDGYVVITFSAIDYLNIHESYDFEVLEWHISHHWAWKVHPEIQKFILKNNEEKVKYKKLSKQETNPDLINEYKSRSQRAKINNNSYYGKFGEDIIKKGKTPYLTLDRDVEYIQDREEIQGMGRRKYLPVAIATTAWARYHLVTFANTLGENFIYCDTDSVHYLRKNGDALIKEAQQKGIFEISDTDLGAWKLEGYFDRGRYLRSKCYYEEKYGEEPEVTLAGLPADDVTTPKKRSCCTWENFHLGLKIKGGNGKLRSVRTPTGNKLIPTDFEINEKVGIFAF